MSKSDHLEAITKEIGSLRGWLGFLERDIARHESGGVFSAVLIMSIAESCGKIVYNAGMANGAVLYESEHREVKKS